jgi:hypothetical protein
LRQQFLAIGRPRRSTLFKLDDMPTNFPTSFHLYHIYRTQGALAALLDQIAQVR